MWKDYDLVPLVTDSSTLTPNEVNANTESYMQIWFRNLVALLSLLVKRTSSSYGVVGRFCNRTLPFSQHKENCGLLLFDFANRSLIHIFALQNPQIVSIFPQSHHVGADVSLFPNNCNASLPREGCAHVVAYCMVCHSRRRRLLHSCGISNGLADSIRCLAHCFLYKWLWHSCANFDASWLNFAGALICGTWFSKE
jgi:hypothetical protein